MSRRSLPFFFYEGVHWTWSEFGQDISYMYHTNESVQTTPRGGEGEGEGEGGVFFGAERNQSTKFLAVERVYPKQQQNTQVPIPQSFALVKARRMSFKASGEGQTGHGTRATAHDQENTCEKNSEKVRLLATQTFWVRGSASASYGERGKTMVPLLHDGKSAAFIFRRTQTMPDACVCGIIRVR